MKLSSQFEQVNFVVSVDVDLEDKRFLAVLALYYGSETFDMTLVFEDTSLGKFSRYADEKMRLYSKLPSSYAFCYMHHDCVPLIIHRDISSKNFLNLESSDFGGVAGTQGYLAPGS
ncbi:Protein kinase-like domain containing protein [Trema orientale]|uniref:Protein kinase-like domain containing protein n=1 Tax=Trema orientale TaxID=63057 RepID=A0A2P5CZG2_TREOI|nr:Protein kinase-like domain containing protein [Trema orientale]